MRTFLFVAMTLFTFNCLLGCSGSETPKSPAVSAPPPENSGEDIKAKKGGRFPKPPK